VAVYKRLSSKLLQCSDLFGRKDLPITTIAHYCPGCDELHHFAIDRPFSNGCRWTIEGDFDRPTFTPSMDVGRSTKMRCHYVLTNGRIRYLADCHHDLAGITVEMQDVPESAVEWMKEAA
jgi:hypothetical protein